MLVYHKEPDPNCFYTTQADVQYLTRIWEHSLIIASIYIVQIKRVIFIQPRQIYVISIARLYDFTLAYYANSYHKVRINKNSRITKTDSCREIDIVYK